MNREERRAAGDHEPAGLGIEKMVSDFISGIAPMTEELDAFLIRFERIETFFIYGQIEQTALMLRTIAAQLDVIISAATPASKIVLP